LLILFAVSLIIPAISNAGSVSSRYDVTFGGFVKFDVGWTSQNANADASTATRSSTSSRGVLADDYGNTFMSGAETRLNFLIKGPDLWGAKTSAFIEGDFRGATTGNAYGGFQLRHAWMKLKWQSAELMFGQNWQQWGMPYYGAWMGVGDQTPYLRGIRVPQATIRYFFTKEFNAMFGLTSATEWSGTSNYYGTNIRQSNDGFARSSWPGLEGEVAYATDRCGKIGSNNLKFALGGYFGKDTEAYDDGTSSYASSTVNAWIAAFRYSVPIVPEKKGNKAMAVLLNGNFFLGQDPSGSNWLGTSGTSQGSYQRPDGSYTAPTVFGLFAQLSWWLTDSLSLNGMYGYLKYNYSEYGRGSSTTARNKINMNQSYAANLLWDANQAIRFGIEWIRNFSGYNGYGAPTASVGTGNADRTGAADVYRFGAWYFF
jgi:hypothetical protein